jgi:hypothetical protein
MKAWPPYASRNLLVNFFFFILLFLVSLPGTLLNAPVGTWHEPLVHR